MELNPELLMKKKFKAKCQFRALVRLCMANTYWLAEALEQYEGDDVKRRVEQAVRSSKKKKQLLNINDKALLNKPAHERTDHEKKYIYRIIGGLKCFKRYPSHVKRKLAALTYFKYYGPNRVIVRQNQEAHAMYFIAAGKVTVSHMVFDELLHQEVSVDIGSMGVGDLFGEVSLLHNIPRTATVTTNDHCEFLALMKDDFKNVLQVSIQRQWDEVRQAMSAFSYFDGFDEVALREGCIVAKLRAYEVNDIILGDGQGVPNHVFFILAGRVQMIESLQISITRTVGHTFYSLHDPYVTPEESEQDLDKKYFAAYNNARKASNASETAQEPETRRETEDVRKSKVGISCTVMKCPSGIAKSASVMAKSGSVMAKSPSVMAKSGSVIPTGASKKFSQSISQMGTKQKTTSQINKELESRYSLQTTSETKRSSIMRHSIVSGASKGSASEIFAPSSLFQERLSTRLSIITEETPTPKPSIETYFMQVCIMNAGSTFGFGENMRDRRIKALTPVFCMLMPMVWLMQWNTANIWTRIRHYLEKSIPTKQELFKEFVNQCNWTEYRNMLVHDVVMRTNAVNYTSVHDVPYSIRLDEMLDV